MSLYLVVQCLPEQRASQDKRMQLHISFCILNLLSVILCIRQLLIFPKFYLLFRRPHRIYMLVVFLILFVFTSVAEYIIIHGIGFHYKNRYRVFKKKSGFLIATFFFMLGNFIVFMALPFTFLPEYKQNCSWKSMNPYAFGFEKYLYIGVLGLVILALGCIGMAYFYSNAIYMDGDSMWVTVQPLRYCKRYSFADIRLVRISIEKGKKVLVILWKDDRVDRIEYWITKEDSLFVKRIKKENIVIQ